MKEITKLDVLSVAKIQAIIMAIFGLLLGLFVTLGSILAVSALGEGASLGVASIIVFPILYALLGFISGALGALLYNLAAGWVGGMKIEFKE